MLAQQERLHNTVMNSFGTVAKTGWMPDTSGVAEPWQYRGGVASTVLDSLAEHDRLMQSFGPSATMTKAADIYATAGLVAKGSVKGEPFGLPKALDAQSVAADILRVQEELDEHQRMQDKLSSFGLSATVAGGADIYGKLGTVAKAGWMPDTSGVAKAWQSQTGIGSAFQDKLSELERMQDRVMRSFEPPASVAGTADMYGIAGPSVAKGSMVGEPFGFAKSLDAHRGAAYVSPAHKRVDEMLRSLDSLTASARAAVAYGMLGSVAGVGGYGPGFSGVGTIAGLVPSLTDVGGLARITDEIARAEGSFAIPSAVTDTARTLAGSAQLAGTITGVDPSTGLVVPKGIDEYLRASAVAGGHAMPTGGPTQPVLVVPTAAESASLLEWLRDHKPTHPQAVRVCYVLAALHPLAMFIEYEANMDPSPALIRAELRLGVVLAILSFLLHWTKPRD